ncbi:MAG: squalene--hopene cyclase, partial [Planctomycetales bacterium]|nr:squalene--hopene cyclase [Planctomycetales bacterium]
MKLGHRVRLMPTDDVSPSLPPFTAPEDSPYARQAPLRQAIGRTRSWLHAEQHGDGFWVGELEGDSILESEYLLLLAYLGQEHSPIARKCAAYMLELQQPEGGWGQYPGGEIDISASVKAYFALKLVGQDPASEPMLRARRAILAAGGADRVNSFTRFYLALLGQIPYACCPEVPPEAVLLPKWSPINLYRVSAWSRTIIVPLSIMSALRPVREIDSQRGIRELFLETPENWPPLACPGQTGGKGLLSWDRFFRGIDGLLKTCRRWNVLPLRRRALKQAKQWMLERFEASDGLGAIFPPIVWSWIALDALGYPAESPEVACCREQLEGLILEDTTTARLQPCKSPVWDTAITLRALAASGSAPDDEAVEAAVDWLLNNEIRRAGDWAATVEAQPGGWCFEHANEFYPDVDDTAMVLLALRHQLDEAQPHGDSLPPTLHIFHDSAANVATARAKAERCTRIGAAAQRAIDWMLAMQNKDGGWGAFDKDNDREFLCHVPFADHNAMIDPSTPDLTARVLEALGAWGYDQTSPAVRKALDYLRATQMADGSWFGRWGVNFIYGTWQTLVGMTAVGVATDDPAIVAGANWLICHQQPSGG